MRTKLLHMTLTTLTALLTACGGGGGGGDVSGTPSLTPATVTMSALQAPTIWPTSFKSVSVAQASLASTAELAATTNNSKVIFIQVWYLNQAQQRQTLAMLSLYALGQMGGTLTLTGVPSSITVLKSEVYTANGINQLTLASKDISI